MLNLVTSGKRKNNIDTNEHHLYVEKAIMDETYGVARRANIPADEAGQIRMTIRESLGDIGSLKGDKRPRVGTQPHDQTLTCNLPETLDNTHQVSLTTISNTTSHNQTQTI
jgi:hypothetical protein